MYRAIELSRVCRTTGRDDGKILLTGDTFTVEHSHRKWGTLERDICIVDNGISNNGGYWVSESFEDICYVISNDRVRTC